MPFIEIAKNKSGSGSDSGAGTGASTPTPTPATTSPSTPTPASPSTSTSSYPTLDPVNGANPVPPTQQAQQNPAPEPAEPTESSTSSMPASPYPTLETVPASGQSSAQDVPEGPPAQSSAQSPVQPNEDQNKSGDGSDIDSDGDSDSDIREIKGPDFEESSTQPELMESVKPVESEPPVATQTAQTISPEKPSQPEEPSQNAQIPVPTVTPAPEALTTQASDIHEFMKLAVEKNASDIHISVANPVFIRVDGRLQSVGVDPLNKEQVESILKPLLNPTIKEELDKNMETDFMYFEESVNSRFRANVFYEKGQLAAAFRLIPTKVRTIDELKLPYILKEFSKIPYGLVLVTGPTGSGKSTTIAAMIEEINRTEPKHIVTIEDPVEYVYEKQRALIAQRSMHYDTKSWNNALRSALRQDPDVVVIGEMRDFETIASAMTIAETGHLVFATLHTNTAAQSIDRIIDVFPEGQQNQVRAQLAGVLSGVISQRLVPLKNGGRKAAIELLIGTVATKNAIREGKTHQIDNIIQTSADVGMQTLEKSLVEMVRNGEIDIESAKQFTTKPEEIDLLLR